MKMIQHQLGTYINVAQICSVSDVWSNEYFGFRVSMANGDIFSWSFCSELEARRAHNEIIELIEAEK